MGVDPLLAAAVAAIGSFIGAGGVKLAARRRNVRPSRPMRILVNVPSASRANLSVFFQAQGDDGPFAARATLFESPQFALTRDSVDGLPDGEDRGEVLAPMIATPLTEDLYRLVGLIGIEGPVAEAPARVLVEIFDRRGRSLASQVHDL